MRTSSESADQVTREEQILQNTAAWLRRRGEATGADAFEMLAEDVVSSRSNWSWKQVEVFAREVEACRRTGNVNRLGTVGLAFLDLGDEQATRRLGRDDDRA